MAPAGCLEVVLACAVDGQAAAAVVLTECDMAQLDPINKRLLFVGLTRVRVHLEWVISADTASMLETALLCKPEVKY